MLRSGNRALTPELLAALAALGVACDSIPILAKRMRKRAPVVGIAPGLDRTSDRYEAVTREGMPELLKPDICVIGAGSGGLSVAAAAAAFGVPVVLIEKGRMGGDCLNTGCVPSKSLIAAGKRARAIAQAPALRRVGGAAPTSTSRDVHRHVHDVIAAIAPNDSKERFGGLGVRVIEGAARFKDKRTVAVGERVRDQGAALRDRDRLVAGGAADSRARGDAAPHQRDGVRSHRAARASGGDRRRADRPRAGAGVPPARRGGDGAGSGAAAGAGRPRMRRHRARCSSRARASTLRAGVEVAAGRGGRSPGSGSWCRAGDGEEAIDGSHLLVATGRRANVDGLGLEQAGIALRRPAASGSTRGCAPPTSASTRSATWRAARNSPTPPTTMPAS